MRKLYLLIILLVSVYASQGQYAVSTCSGVSTGFVYTGTTSYTWGSPGTAGLGGQTAGGAVANFTQLLTNNTSAPITSTYSVFVLPAAIIITIDVTVNPNPSVSAVTDIKNCAGTLTTVNFSTTPSVLGATFDWSKDPVAIGLAGGLTGTGNIGPFTTSTSNVPVTSVFTVTAMSNSCTGTPISFSITVNPTPSVVPISPQSICNGFTTTSVIFSGPVANTIYNWTTTNISIGGLGSTFSGTGDIGSFTANNASNSPITALITVTPFSNSCYGTASAFTITANPTPSVYGISNQTVCDATLITLSAFNGPVTNSTFNWTSTTATIGLGALSGTGNITPFTSTNASGVPITAFITVQAFSNSCAGTTASFSLTVNPVAPINAMSDITACKGTIITPAAFTSPLSGVTFTWTNTDPTVGIGFASGSGNILAFTATSFFIPVIDQVTVTANYLGCSGLTTTFNITANPIPNVNPLIDQVLCNATTVTVAGFGGSVGGTNFDWVSTTASIGIGSLTGTGNIITFTSTNGSSVPVTAIITVTPSSNTCIGAATTFSLTVNPVAPVNAMSDITACNGTIITPAAFTSPLAGTIFTWSNTNSAVGTLLAGASGNISPFTAIAAINPAYDLVTVTASYLGCTGLSTTFNIIVNPTPSINTISDLVKCTATSVTVASFAGSVTGTNFTWSSTTAAIGLGGLTGTGNISTFTSTNVSTVPITAYVTVSAISNSCSGSNSTFSITINPIATVNPLTNITACSGTIVSPGSFVGPVAGTTYAWTNSDPTIGIGPGASGNISAFTTTSGGAPAIATITVSPTANSCLGTPFTYTISVNPTPTVNSVSSQNYCSGVLVASIPFSGFVPTANFNWVTTTTVIGIGSLTGTGSNIASFTSANPSNLPVTANITVTPFSNACTGTSTSFTITVNPVATANPISPVLACGGLPVSVASFTSAISGTTYTWTNSDITIGLLGSGIGSTIAFTAASLATPTPATITIQPIAYGCNGTTSTFTITINPTPVINPVLNQQLCNSQIVNLPGFSGSITGTNYNWVSTTAAIGLSSLTGTGTIPTFTSTNTFNVPVSANITVTPVTNTCSGTPTSFSVTIYPTVSVNQVSPQTLCNGVAISSIVFSGPISGTTYAWANSNVGINLAAGSTGNIPAFTPVNLVPTPVTAIIAVTPTANGCAGTQMTFTMNVGPTPTVNAIPTQTPCNGTLTTNIVFSGFVGNSTYNWTNNTSSIGLAVSGSGTINAFNATNGSGLPVTASLSVTPISNTCTGSTVNFTIIVNPTPSVNFIANQALCNTFNTTAINFSGLVPGTTYSWTNTTPSIGLLASGTGNIPTFAAVNAGTTPVTAVIAVTTLSNSCSGGTQSFSITVNPTPTLVSSLTPPANCNGVVFNYSAASVTPGTTYTWNRAAIAVINSNTSNSAANGTISEVLTNSNASAVSVVYAFTLTANSCSNAQNVTVVINPTANFNSTLSPTPICTGTNFSYVASSATSPVSFSWSRPNVAGITAGGAFSGTGNISETLLNNTTAPINVAYYYTVSTSGCANVKTFTVTLTVNPTPVLSGTLTPTPVCSNAIFAYPATSATIGTAFTWSRTTVTGISSGGPVSGTGNISETLLNANNIFTNLDYVYSLTANGCSNTQNVTIGVYPLPILSSTTTPLPVCSNALFSYIPSSTTGNSFNWARTSTLGITNGPASGTNDPAETLVNVTPLPVNVTYTYTIITAAGCSNPQTITVTINPTPVLSSSLTPPAICSGNVFSYVPTSATPGTAFNWGRAVVPFVTNGAATGLNNPGELLINPTTSPAGVAYTYTLTANSCTNNQTVSLTVNPIPVINAQTTATCSNTAFTITPSNTPATTIYTWNNPVILPVASTIGGSAQATGLSSISQLLTNQTTNSASATYTVLPVATGCSGLPFTLTVTINPLPFVANQLLTAICSATPFSYTPSGIPAGTTYTWGIPTQNAANNLTGGGAQPVSQTLISQTLTSSNNLMDTAYYSVIPATALCIGNAFTITVPVKPVPIIANLRDTICSGAKFQVTPAPVPANTTYTWNAAPVSTPAGSITGGSAQVLPVSSLSQTLVNVTNAIAQTVYTIIPSAGNCPGPSFNLIETVARPLPAFGNQPAVICSGTAFNATPPSAPGGTVYTWTIPVSTPPGGVTGMSAALTPVSSVSQTLVNLLNVTDTVVYTVTPYLNNCAGPTFTATVRVLPLPQAIISAQPAICQNPLPDTLTVKFTGTAPWSFNYNDNGFIGSKNGITSSPYTLLLPAVSKTTTIRTVTISNVKDAACINTIDSSTAIQKINPLPVGQIISMHGVYLCNGIKDTLYIQSKDSLGYQWKFNGAQIPGATTDSIATGTAGTYQAILTNQYACTDTAVAPVTLILAQQPVLKFSFDTSCIFSLINFKNLTDTSVTGTIKWLWSFGNGKTDTAMNTSTRYQTAGNYRVTLKASQLFCPSYPPTKLDSSINIQSPIPDTTLPSVSAYKGQLTPVNGRSFPGYQYQWTPSAGIVNPDSASTSFNYASTQQYTIKLISPSGCITNDSLLVRVFDDKLIDVLVPKSFTPNGDGVNDILYPYLTGVKEFHFFRVLNRYGKLLFESKNADTGWNGTLNGVAQPMGIYFWVSEAKLNDGSVVQKSGQVLLIR